MASTFGSLVFVLSISYNFQTVNYLIYQLSWKISKPLNTGLKVFNNFQGNLIIFLILEGNKIWWNGSCSPDLSLHLVKGMTLQLEKQTLRSRWQLLFFSDATRSFINGFKTHLTHISEVWARLKDWICGLKLTVRQAFLVEQRSNENYPESPLPLLANTKIDLKSKFIYSRMMNLAKWRYKCEAYASRTAHSMIPLRRGTISWSDWIVLPHPFMQSIDFETMG
jgi:hypothetical protein